MKNRSPSPPRPTRVAYQGEPGAFSELALHRLCGRRVRVLPCRDLATLERALARGRADAAVLPLSNSLVGEVPGVAALIRRRGLSPRGSLTLPVAHCLIAPRGASLAAIRRVLSHPVALAQCANFFAARPALRPVPVHDTAGAVRLILARGRADEAAIAGAPAARAHGGRVLLRGVADRRDNRTRFALFVPRKSTARFTGGARDRYRRAAAPPPRPRRRPRSPVRSKKTGVTP